MEYQSRQDFERNGQSWRVPTFWRGGNAARRLDLEFDVTNVSNSVYQIAKESDEIPIQYSPSRTAGGSVKFHF